MVEYDKNLFRLRIFYSLFTQLLDTHFSGYFIFTSQETNRIYLKLCIKIEEILKQDGFESYASEDWKPFDNLLYFDSEQTEETWEYGGRENCLNFQSEIETDFIKHGEKSFDLDNDDKLLIVETRNFLAQYNSEKKKDPEKMDNLIKKMEPRFLNTFENKQNQSKREEVLEIPKDNFKGLLRTFISHKFEKENQKLALTLRNILRAKNVEGYLAESKKEYELLIGEKIRKEIERSDYVIGIITTESEKSSSVNQELGYALGLNKPIVIMIEKNVPHGVLTHGRETEEFIRENFEKSCINVSEYILEKGTPTKIKFVSDSEEFDIILDKFTENGNHLVGIRNAKGKAIKSCSMLCAQQKCLWWNTNDSYPRNISEGEAGNVFLPRGFANINPIITVMSGDKAIQQIRLSEIARRPSVKWSAEDENEVQVERLTIAINRIRSNLATMYTLYQIFLDYPEGFPSSDELMRNLSQKDELVDNTQTITNQTSHMLEIDWMNSINDLCMLAKKHPWVTEGKQQVLQCEHCAGIISQIQSILEKLPNPPV